MLLSCTYFLLVVVGGYTVAGDLDVAKAFGDAFDPLITPAPKSYAALNYTLYSPVLGDTLPFVGAMTQPKISWTANSSSIYTVLCKGQDLPLDSNQTVNEVLHWLVVNIPETTVASGVRLMPYLPPVPNIKSALYSCLVYLQGSTLTTTQMNSISFNLSAPNFDVIWFAKNFNMSGPVAGNFFKLSYTEALSEAIQTIYKVVTPFLRGP